MEKNWTKEDLKVYVLIYCANADFNERKREDDFIKSHVNADNFDEIHREFERDNDFKSIQKIQAAMKELNYTDAERDDLFQDAQAMFHLDREPDILEDNIIRGLKHLLY